jgi:hypothetical protein
VIGFLTPAFLVGLLAIAVPVLVHLVHRERRQTMAFPSLMFLRRVPHRSVRRRRVRHWLLLALRSAGVALLAFAFARPVLTGGETAGAPAGGSTARVVLVDRSWSMGYGDRWPRALAQAHRVLGEGGEGDVAGLVFFGEKAEATGPLGRDHEALEAALGEVELGWEGTRLAPALKLAARLLDEAALEKKELVLVSDFQKHGLDGIDEVRLPAGTDVRWVDVSEPGTRNLGITDVTLQRVYERDRERVAIAARVVSQGEGPAGPVPMTLELGGRELQTQTVALEGESAATVRFDPVAFPEGVQRGLVRLEGDALPQDDAFRFVLAPGRDLGVLIVERDGALGGESLFLRRALAIGERPRFEVRVRPRSVLGVDDLAGVSVVILNDVAWPPGAAGEGLRALVEKGGGVVAALSARSRAAGWGGPAAGLLPGNLDSQAVDRSADWGGTLAYLDYDHPVFDLFSRPRSGDFSQARFLRYRALDAGTGAVLARFDDASPALVETPLGEGRILFWTSSLDTLWNDLPLQPVFLPFLHKLVAHAAAYSERPAGRRVGDVLELPSEDGREWIAQTPGDERVRIGPDQHVVGLEAAGFYELHPSADEGGLEALTVAVNVDPAESDLSAADPEEVVGGLLSAPGDVVAGGEALTRDERERRQGVWWFVLLAAVALLAAETALSNRLSQAVR